MNPLTGPVYYLNTVRYLPQQINDVLPYQLPLINQGPPTVASYRARYGSQPELLQTYNALLNPSQAIVNGIFYPLANAIVKFKGKKQQ